jgi:hypothetical protein
VLDKQVVDRNGREMGRVDGILAEHEERKPPRLAAVLIGPAALGDRLSPRIGRWVRWVEKRAALAEGRPVRIACSEIADVGAKVVLRIAVGNTTVDVVEQRLRRWLVKIPGSR